MFEGSVAEARFTCGCAPWDPPCVEEMTVVGLCASEERATLEASEWEWDHPEVQTDDDAHVFGLPEVLLSPTHEPGPDGAAELADLGQRLAQIRPGPELARLLEDIDRDLLDEFDLVEVAAAYRRMEAWSAARAAAAAADLAERPALNPMAVDAKGRRVAHCLAGDELAVRLGLSRFAARRMVAAGAAFRTTLVATGEALETGQIDARKAETIVTVLDPHPAQVAWAAEQEVLPRAGLRTHTQLTRDLAAALVAVDPDEADDRHARACRDRRVNHPRPLPDGMASIYAVMPAADAVGLDLALEAAARAAKNNGDQRTLDQLRADTLALLGHTALETGWIGPPETDPTRPGSAAPTVEPPGSDAGRGERRPSPLRRMRLGMIGGGRTQIRVTVPLAVVLPPDPTKPQRCAPWDLDAPPGLRDVPELEGYGPIAPEVARALALSGTWQRLLTDPATGAVLDVGRTRYQPPAELAAYVRERDRTCIRPGCSADARTCDLDHTRPWSQRGPTAADNLTALCPHDHAVKTLGAFHVRHLDHGAYEWTTPTGHAYRRAPDGTVTLLPRTAKTRLLDPDVLAGHGRAAASAGDAWDDAHGDDDEPPF